MCLCFSRERADVGLNMMEHRTQVLCSPNTAELLKTYYSMQDVSTVLSMVLCTGTKGQADPVAANEERKRGGGIELYGIKNKQY